MILRDPFDTFDVPQDPNLFRWLERRYGMSSAFVFDFTPNLEAFAVLKAMSEDGHVFDNWTAAYLCERGYGRQSLLPVYFFSSYIDAMLFRLHFY